MKRLISFFTKLFEAFLPDAFVFGLLLTLLVYVAAFCFTPFGAVELVEFWGKEFWSLNAFTMQMIFVLICGHMLATSPLVKKFLHLLAQLAKNEQQALIILSLFSGVACWINWGFGLIVAGVLAVEFAKKLGKVNFGLFVATAFAGFVVWHAGLSGSIPLKIAGKDEILTRIYPDLSIPLDQTIFTSWNLLAVGLIFLSFPILALWMRTEDKVEIKVSEDLPEVVIPASTWREKIEESRFLNLIFFTFFILVLFLGLKKGEVIDINRINIIFLSLALLLHQTPKKFLKALGQSFNSASGIAIQFPFYAGLMGLMQYSGLADRISELFLKISTADTLALWTFLSGGIVNLFIPSGGGQWVVQGPIMLKAAKELGVDPAKISMALAWGDAWTNLIQPFWALPIIALAGVKLKDIMGYCLMYLGLSGLIVGGILLWM
jgi:short-chain fatty acids transporter